MNSRPLVDPRTFAAVPQPLFPPDTFTLADVMAAQEALREANVSPFVCPSCGASFFFLTCEGARPTHWRCYCGRIEKTRWWEEGPPMRLAPLLAGFVVLGELPPAVVAQLSPALVPVPL